jgi:glycosyltransferase involved in cell wall biosynthesis
MTEAGLSVLISTYQNDNPQHLQAALDSIVEQTHMPDEIVLVEDGLLSTALREVVDEFRRNHNQLFTSVQLSNNSGLGSALKKGVQTCANKFVARMDADDISPPDRFERQLNFLASHPNVDIVGGHIAEFSDDPAEPHARRKVPATHEDIVRLARRRSPLNHASVVFRREAVLAAGNYREVDRMEDWDLWSRLLLNGAQMANIPEVLLYVRAGPLMYGRRGGCEYAREEIRTQIEFLQRGFIDPTQFALNLIARVPIRFLPNSFRRQLYKRYFRS